MNQIALFKILIISTLLVNFSCKPAADTSDTQTLGNFASKNGEIEKNQCVAAAPSIKDLEKVLSENKQLIDYGSVEPADFNKVLAVVPMSVLSGFFALGGKIYLDSNTPKLCEDKIKKEDAHTSAFKEGGVVSSCWLPRNTGGINLYISPKKDGNGEYTHINHTTVRSFGYMLSEIFLHFKFEQVLDDRNENAKQYSWQPIPKQPTQLDLKVMSDLSYAFETDLRILDEQVEDNSLEVEFDLSKFDYLRKSEDISKKRQFQYFVFAEAFDSYFCNGKTEQEMKVKFPKTYNVMNAIAQPLVNIGDRTYAKVKYSDQVNKQCLFGCEVVAVAEKAKEKGFWGSFLDIFSSDKPEASPVETSTTQTNNPTTETREQTREPAPEPTRQPTNTNNTGNESSVGSGVLDGVGSVVADVLRDRANGYIAYSSRPTTYVSTSTNPDGSPIDGETRIGDGSQYNDTETETPDYTSDYDYASNSYNDDDATGLTSSKTNTNRPKPKKSSGMCGVVGMNSFSGQLILLFIVLLPLALIRRPEES